MAHLIYGAIALAFILLWVEYRLSSRLVIKEISMNARIYIGSDEVIAKEAVSTLFGSEA